jgi:hypothetical protein
VREEREEKVEEEGSATLQFTERNRNCPALKVLGQWPLVLLDNVGWKRVKLWEAKKVRRREVDFVVSTGNDRDIDISVQGAGLCDEALI